MAGIKEIAKAAGVSISTVSNVVNGKKNVGEETKELILKLCEEMSYKPNEAKKKARISENRTMLFNFSDFDRSFYLKIINGISDYANANDYDLIICTKKSCEKYMKKSITSGCIILDIGMKNETLMKAADENYPIVVLDRYIHNPYIKSVVVNNYDAMCSLVEGLVVRGYRRFGFIGGPERSADNNERYTAFQDILSKHHIPFLRRNYFSGDYREKSGYTAAKILMLSEELPEILVCANDNMALGAMKAFREQNMRVPEDIAITGFDDCDMAEMAGLTTVAIPNYERGYLAAQYLIENIRDQVSAETIKISAQVKWRKTVLNKKLVK